MKKSWFGIAVLTGCFGTYALVPQLIGAEQVRWGIVTKNTAPRFEQPAEEKPVDAGNSAPAAFVPPETPDRPATEASPQSSSAPDTGGTSQIAGDHPVEDVADTKQAAPIDSSEKTVVKETVWQDPVQKKRCEDYLTQLHDLFLKTRHYSIQGASCETAVNAAAFLEISRSCEGDCPEGLIQNSGYSDRILRNIRYLEKLGNERCGASKSDHGTGKILIQASPSSPRPTKSKSAATTPF